MYKNEFKDLLKVILQGEIIRSIKDEKIILIELSIDIGFKSDVLPHILL